MPGIVLSAGGTEMSVEVVSDLTPAIVIKSKTENLAVSVHSEDIVTMNKSQNVSQFSEPANL